MKMSSRIVCVLFLCLNAVAFIYAQDPSQRQNLATEKKNDAHLSALSAAMTTLFPFRPLDSWRGQRFIFLPGLKASENNTYGDFFGKITHKQYSGRIAKVISVEDFSGRTHIEFEMEDTKEHLRASTLPGKESIFGITLFDDIINARQQWLGKTLWCKEGRLSTYDEKTDEVGLLVIKKYSPVKVVEVKAGWNDEKPVRFVLETHDGKQGFLDLNLSGTNVFKGARHLNRFDHCFVTEDPRKTRKWDAQVWALIENGQIGAGMTAEEVRLSWGEPDKVTRTTTGENWTYRAGTLIFKNGVLEKMQ
jgi:hypothetical protein